MKARHDMTWKRGVTREVILIGKYAVKLPSIRSWKLFLTGLLCNMNEQQFSGFDDDLCPVIFGLWGGWVNIMPRCSKAGPWSHGMSQICTKLGFVERKECSFGLLNGRLVAVDYG